MLTEARLQLLKDILSQPTAPFREQHVAACVTRHLSRHRVPFFTDPTGNLVLGVASVEDYQALLRQQAAEPVRVFIAHMDHPGFHGVRWLNPKRLAIEWLGGSPVKHLAGASVWLANESGLLGYGRLRKVKIHKHGYAIETAEVQLDLALTEKIAAKRLFGGLRFRAPWWIGGKRLYAHAIDDLAGVFAIVSTAVDLYRRRRKDTPPFLGLLTRAEEVGFVGAVRHFELGWLQARTRSVLCVSLEASRNLPGAVMGKGPIVRLGDRRTTFDPGGMRILSDLAMKILPDAHQRRIMDGGSCEATAASAWGLPTIGLTLPLGNYHNQGLDGGADCPKPLGPAPEFVHLEDLDGLLRLTQGLMKPGLGWQDPWAKTRLQLEKNARRHQRFYP